MKKFITGVLFCFLAFNAPSVFAFDYTLTLEAGGTEDLAVVAGEIVNFSFDTTDLGMQIYGNVQIEYDPTVLEALYVDESFDYGGLRVYRFFGWTTAPENPDICGGGEPYMYATGLGSDRGDQYAAYYGDFNAGPSAYIDNINGVIRFYQINYLLPGDYEPLRLGFKVLTTGQTDITIQSQAEEAPGVWEFDWCDFDTLVTTQFILGTPPTAEEIIEEMIWLVTCELNLTNKIERKYLREINKLLRMINKDQEYADIGDHDHWRKNHKIDKTDKILNKIEHFVKKVLEDIHHGRISQEDGTQIIDMAYELYDTVSP